MGTSININPTYPPYTGKRWLQTTDEFHTVEKILKRLEESVENLRLDVPQIYDSSRDEMHELVQKVCF